MSSRSDTHITHCPSLDSRKRLEGTVETLPGPSSPIRWTGLGVCTRQCDLKSGPEPEDQVQEKGTQ